RVQAGLASGLLERLHLTPLEPGVADFQRWVAARVDSRTASMPGGSVALERGDGEARDLGRFNAPVLVAELERGVDETRDGGDSEGDVDGPQLALLDPFGHQAGAGAPPVGGLPGNRRVAMGLVLRQADHEP